jgi:hypothetical protein
MGPYNEINFSTSFGDIIRQYECPACGDIYQIEESKVNSGITHCWKCHKPYLQKYHTTNQIKFVRQAMHFCKGH